MVPCLAGAHLLAGRARLQPSGSQERTLGDFSGGRRWNDSYTTLMHRNYKKTFLTCSLCDLDPTISGAPQVSLV